MKLVILDRDGVINYDSKHYIKNVHEWRPIPGSIEAIARLSEAGIKVAVATNQSGVARALYTEQILLDIHKKMCDLVFEAGGVIEKIVYCPHHPDEGCFCRKPSPGMLLAIAKHFGVDIKNVPFIGDRQSDVACALACGARPILIHSQMTKQHEIDEQIESFSSLVEAVDALIAECS